LIKVAVFSVTISKLLYLITEGKYLLFRHEKCNKLNEIELALAIWLMKYQFNQISA